MFALSESLEPIQMSTEWKDEIHRRIEAIERGKSKLVSWSEVRSRLGAKPSER